MKGFATLRFLRFEIVERDRRAAALEVRRDLLGKFSGIEVHRAMLADAPQRCAQRGDFHQLAFLRQLAAKQEGVDEARRVFQLGEFGFGQLLLSSGDGKAVLR